MLFILSLFINFTSISGNQHLLMSMRFYHLGEKTQSLVLCGSVTTWKMTQCATKNTEYLMEIQTFLFSFSCVSLSFISLLLHCFYAIQFLNMFLAATFSLTGTDVVLGLQWHCSGVTATVCVSTFSGCGESESSSLYGFFSL